jgi:NADH-quinone oxidoreductase subunit N
MAAFLISLIGLPPFAGFLAKLQVMMVLGEAGGWFWALVVVIGVNTIISLYFYARVLRQMYLTDDGRPEVSSGPVGTLIAAGCAVMLLLMLVGGSPLMTLTARFGKLHLPAKGTTAQVESTQTVVSALQD